MDYKGFLILFFSFFYFGLALHAQSSDFIKADADKDRKLSPKEWETVVQQRFKEKNKTGWWAASKRQFKIKDINEDGFLSSEEFRITPNKSKK